MKIFTRMYQVGQSGYQYLSNLLITYIILTTQKKAEIILTNKSIIIFQ